MWPIIFGSVNIDVMLEWGTFVGLALAIGSLSALALIVLLDYPHIKRD